MSTAENAGAPKSEGPGATQRCGHEERISDECASETRTKYQWALLHHSRGWNVIPAHSLTARGRCTCGKPNCSAPGKHPRVDWAEYTTRRSTVEELAEWWRRWSDANIAAVTGETSGRAVVDIDGDQGWLSLSDAGLVLPATVTVETGRDNAVHKHFAFPPGAEIPSLAGILPKVDIRADGGIIMLPGSDHVSGRAYRYGEGAAPEDVLEAIFPFEILALVAARGAEVKLNDASPSRAVSDLSPARSAYCKAALEAECAKVAAAVEGKRNDTLFRAAAAIGSLLHFGLDDEEVAEQLLVAARITGLPEDECISTIRSGLNKGAGSPRASELRSDESVHGLARPPYPLHVLPLAVREFVVEAAACVGCPPDMVAVPLLAYASATIGRTRSIEIKPGYVKHPVFWFGIVGAPGSGKSPADGRARSFVEALQAKAYAEWQDAYQGWRIEHELWKQRVKKSGGGQASMGGQSFDVDQEPIEPSLEHYFTTDATIEALAPILLSSAGVAVAHDELVGWVKSMGAYNGAAGRDRAQVLSLWAERSLKVDRKGRPPLYVEDPVAVIIGGVQPDVLADLAGEADKRDGFIDRFLWSWPEHRPVPWTEDTVSPFTAAAVETVFRRLRGTSGDTVPIRLSDEAKALWRTWYDDNARVVETERGLMAGVHAKADVQLARLALVLHVLEHNDPEAVDVSADTLHAASELVEYHLAHARAVAHRLGVAGNTPRTGHGSTLRQRIVARLQEHGGWVSASDLARALGGHVPADERDRVLDRLEADGLVKRGIKETGELGGRPAVQWRYCITTSELKNPGCAA